MHDKVAFARLTSGSIEISATDWQHQTRAPRQRNTVGLYLSGGTHADLKEVFDSWADENGPGPWMVTSPKPVTPAAANRGVLLAARGLYAWCHEGRGP